MLPGKITSNPVTARAGVAFAISLAAHGVALAAVMWLLGSGVPGVRSAPTLSVILASPSPAQPAVDAQQHAITPAVVARDAGTPRPAPAAVEQPREAVITVDVDAQQEAERRRREVLAARDGGAIAPPEFSDPQPVDPGQSASADAGTQRDGRSGPASDLDATRGFVALHVLDWLAQHKQYPRAARRAGIEGVVHVRFVIDPAGRIAQSRIEQSSGARVLDAAALALLQRASPVPGLAQYALAQSLELRLPIDYRLRRASSAG